METTMHTLSKLILAAVVCLCPSAIYAQSAVTNVISFTHSDVNGMFMPPELYADIDFIDQNGNKILEGRESGTISIKIENFGGSANGVKVMVTPRKYIPGLIMEKQTAITDIPSNSTATVEFPVTASISIPTASVEFDIKIKEPMGYDIGATMVLSTFAYPKSKISMQGVTIVDSGFGARALNQNPDGKVQKGEVVWVNVTLQNVGEGVAEGVKYRIRSADPNVQLMTDSGFASEITGNLDNLLVGQTTEVKFRLSPTNNYQSVSNYLPVRISVTEDTGLGNLAATTLPVELGKTPAAPHIVDIKGDNLALLAAQSTIVYSESNRVSSKIRDISQAPAGVPLYKDAIAIVIGAEKNNYGVAPAPYAARDAQLLEKYFRTSMGVGNVKLLVNESVTSVALKDIFDPNYGTLKNNVVPGKTDVFVFYSGHGIPDGDDVYLFPSDARKEMVSERGYSVNKLYSDLNSLNAKSVTVILDACFSGYSRYTASRESQNIAMAKGVRISDGFREQPWTTNPNFRVFTSSSSDQTSLGYDQSQSGLFTYFLAAGLQGDADNDGDGTIRMDELVDYVQNNVSAEARRIRGSDQTPKFYGKGDFVMEKIK